MKDRYFAHDFGARNDPKLIELQMEMKGTGLGIWWCLVEMLWENDGYLPMNYRSIAFSIRWAKPADIERVVNDFGLFENDGERFWSRSALTRIQEQKDIAEEASERGRKAAKTRWKSDENADAMQAQSESTASGMPIKKEINKKINKKNMCLYTPTAKDRQKLFEIFFFELNTPDPGNEVRRFIDYYTARGWKLGDGNPVADVFATARTWTPLTQTKRLPKMFLQWYRHLYDGAQENPGLITTLADGEYKGNTATLRYTSKQNAEAAMNLIKNQDLAKDVNITWKFNN